MQGGSLCVGLSGMVGIRVRGGCASRPWQPWSFEKKMRKESNEWGRTVTTVWTVTSCSMNRRVERGCGGRGGDVGFGKPTGKDAVQYRRHCAQRGRMGPPCPEASHWPHPLRPMNISRNSFSGLLGFFFYPRPFIIPNQVCCAVLFSSCGQPFNFPPPS